MTYVCLPIHILTVYIPIVYVHTHTYVMQGWFLTIFYSVHALGIIHQQQSWFGAIC